MAINITWKCECCSNVVVQNYNWPHFIDIVATCNNLVNLCHEGKMTALRGHCPLEKLAESFLAETQYIFYQYMRCNICKRVLLWGLCVRSAPIYRKSDIIEMDEQRWK